MTDKSELLEKAFDKRLHFFKGQEEVFRIFNGAGDGIDELVADYYSGYVLIQNFGSGFFNHESYAAILSGLCVKKSVPLHGVLFKDRGRVAQNEDPAEKRKSILVDGRMPGDDFTARHMGLDVSVDLISSQNTGLFFDMRNSRNRLLDYYSGFESVLNLFSYTCVFSLHALKNKVKRAVNVDISNPVLKRGMNNYVLNGIEPNSRDFIKGRSVDLIKYFRKKNMRFSLSIIDPPTFARSQKGKFSAEKDFVLHLEMLAGISDYVFSSVNTRRIGRDEFTSMHPSCYSLVFADSEPEDFPHSGTPYLKTALWKIKG